MSRSDFPLPGGIRGLEKWVWVDDGVLQRLSGAVAQVQFECIETGRPQDLLAFLTLLGGCKRACEFSNSRLQGMAFGHLIRMGIKVLSDPRISVLVNDCPPVNLVNEYSIAITSRIVPSSL